MGQIERRSFESAPLFFTVTIHESGGVVQPSRHFLSSGHRARVAVADLARSELRKDCSGAQANTKSSTGDC